MHFNHVLHRFISFYWVFYYCVVITVWWRIFLVSFLSFVCVMNKVWLSDWLIDWLMMGMTSFRRPTFDLPVDRVVAVVVIVVSSRTTRLQDNMRNRWGWTVCTVGMRDPQWHARQPEPLVASIVYKQCRHVQTHQERTSRKTYSVESVPAVAWQRGTSVVCI